MDPPESIKLSLTYQHTSRNPQFKQAKASVDLFRTSRLQCTGLRLSQNRHKLPRSQRANRIKTSLDFFVSSRVHCTGLRLSLTPSQTSRIPDIKQVIPFLRDGYLVIKAVHQPLTITRSLKYVIHICTYNDS